MGDRFTSQFFVNNRLKLRQIFAGTAPIVIAANCLLQKSADEAYPFRQDSSFWYFTGIDEPGMVLVIDKDREYLILPDRSDYQDAFDGPLNETELSQQSGIDELYAYKPGWKLLNNRLKKVKHVATLGASTPFIAVYNMFANPGRSELIRHLKSRNEHIELLDLRPAVAKLRMVKQPEELRTIKSAVSLTTKVLHKIGKKISSFRYAYEIDADVTYQFIRHGADNAWPPVVAAGTNSCVIHAHSGDEPLQPKDMIIVDIGARLNHYVADLTRSFVSDGTFTTRQQNVYLAVKEVQQFAFGLQKPGVTLKHNEQLVEQFMGEKLRELGLIKTIDKDNVRRYFNHATSHYMGIDPHDAGDYEQPLTPGVVLTVEPGIYIPEEGFGIRLEDDICITNQGFVLLSKHLPYVF